jgi:hypothetical protein
MYEFPGFLLPVKTAWIDHFGGQPTESLNQRTYNSRQTPSNTSVYVSNCLFSSFTSSSNGGALCCMSTTYLLVESSSFFSCKTSSRHGGAIYFEYSSGQFVLYGVCGNDCYTEYTGSGLANGQFACTYVNNAVSSKNNVNYSSVTRCLNTRSNAHANFYLINGKIFCLSVNMSMNTCYYYPGFWSVPFIDSNSVTCSLSYSSFTDNHAPNYILLCLNKGGARYEIKCSNIIRNTQVSTSYGTIYSTGNTMIQDSCILENEANCIFYATSSYTITLSNCTIDSDSHNGNLNKQSTITKSFILALNHLSTRNCYSEYDSVGTLTAIPVVTQSSKKEFRCSCKIINYQAKVCDFFSLNWVFMITFIHPNIS